MKFAPPPQSPDRFPVLTEVLQVPVPSVPVSAPVTAAPAVDELPQSEWDTVPAPLGGAHPAELHGTPLADRAPPQGLRSDVPDLLAKAGPSSPGQAALPSEDEVVQRVLVDLERQLEVMFELRLRETMTPLLARLADTLVRESRHELASTLREMVQRAVAQELGRLSSRPD